jgi:hypothetical protein
METITCSLDAGALEDRLAEFAAIGANGMLGATLRFDAALEDRLAAVVEAERRCCPWLGISLERGDGWVELRLSAPPDGAVALGAFVAAFAQGAVSSAA